jgi:hypothetical protein
LLGALALLLRLLPTAAAAAAGPTACLLLLVSAPDHALYLNITQYACLTGQVNTNQSCQLLKRLLHLTICLL